MSPGVYADGKGARVDSCKGSRSTLDVNEEIEGIFSLHFLLYQRT